VSAGEDTPYLRIFMCAMMSQERNATAISKKLLDRSAPQ
jgi:hypothetical protein